MRTFLILVCSVALACSVGAAQNDNKAKKQAKQNRQTQSRQYARPAPAGGAKKATPKYNRPTSTATSYQKAKARQTVNTRAYQSRPNVTPVKKTSQQFTTRNAQASRYTTKKTKQGQQSVNRQAYQSASNVKKPNKSAQQIAAQNAQVRRNANSATYAKKTKQWQGNNAAFQKNGKKYKAQRFNLASNTRPTKYAAVKFQENRRINGSQYWQGKNYWAFRNYNPVWHDRSWLRNRYNRIVFVYGGWYYWNSGWWYPAWGYAPNSYYAYDGPIYGYNSLPPDQVVANVQAALQADGYYQGEVDGLLGPLTRDAIAGYQRDNGLYETAAIDQPTLESLGMS
jgi:hypothetical protein